MPKLFVGGISPKFTEIQLAELLAIHGEILTVKIIYDRVTKKAKGYGFVEMRDLNGAQQAIDALDGTTIGARELKVGLVEEDNKELHKGNSSNSPTRSEKTKRKRKTSYLAVPKGYKP